MASRHFLYMISLFTDNGGVQPHFCPWKNGKKSIWKEREKYSFPSLSTFFPFFPLGKNGKAHIFPWAKMGLDPPPDNAFVLFSELQPGLVQNIRQSGRKEFILRLGEELSRPQMELRTNSVSYMLRVIMCEKHEIARPQHPQFPETPGYAVVGKCHIICRRTRSKCLRCKQSACKECGIR